MYLKTRLFNNFMIRSLSYLFYRYKRLGLFHHFNIRQKLITCFIIIGIIPLIVSGLIQYYFYVNTLPKQYADNTMQTLEQADKNITYELNMLKQYLTTIQLNQEIISSLSVSQNLSEVDTAFKIYDINTLLNNYDDYSSNRYVTIYVNWKNEHQILFSHNTLKLMQTDQEKDWYNYLANNKSNKIYWRGSHQLVNSTMPNTFFSGCNTIRDFTKNKVLGIMEVNIDTQTISSIIQDINLGDKGFLMFIDDEGKVIAENNAQHISPGNAEYLYKLLQQNADTETGTEKGSLYTKINNIESLIIYKTNAITNWKLIGVVPVAKTYEKVNFMASTTFFIILACITFATALAIPISYSVSEPIRKLKNVMKNIEDENFDIHIEPKTKDEIGELCISFNHMVDKIKDLIQKVYKTEIEKKNAELKTLQAQINPHFLYNTLDTMNWLAIIHKNNDIAVMARALANFFRYSLSKGNNIIPVKDEIELVKSYVQIQKMRLSDQIEVEFVINDEILAYRTLKLILQPIVENSILHGLNKTIRKIHIQICGEIIDNKLLFTVIDNGCGADLAEIDHILNSSQSTVTKGYGIRNVNERIKLYCGKEFGLKYFNTNEHGTKVEIWSCLICEEGHKVC